MILIVPHITADFDALASACAAWKLHPGASIYLPGGLSHSVQKYLDEVPHGLPLVSFKQIDLDAVQELIVVDTSDSSRLGEVAELVARKDVTVKVYDHHFSGDGDLDALNQFSTEAGANTTNFIHLIRKQNIPLAPEEATLLALGIYEDTGMLTFETTKPADLEALAFLLVRGAKLGLVRQYVSEHLEFEQWEILQQLRERLELHDCHGISIAMVVSEVPAVRFQLATLAHHLLDSQSADGVVMLIQIEDRLHLIVRSNVPAFDSSVLCEEFGGGGHPGAASATIRNRTLNETRELVLRDLPKAITKALKIRDIMSAPARYVHPRHTIAKALEVMNKYHVNNLCVVDDDDRLLGMISRQIVDRVLHHGLGAMEVSEHTVENITTLSVEMDLQAAKRAILANPVSFTPVLDGERVRGVLTRTDILKMVLDEQVRNIQQEKAFSERATHLPRNIRSKLRKALPQKLRDLVAEAGVLADELGVAVFLVGGIVRDILLQRKNQDVDLVIEGDGIAFAKALAERTGGRFHKPTHFGTAKVQLEDSIEIDIATARAEFYTTPVALPTVDHGSMKQDSYRRDFTINTLAVSLNEATFGDVIDYFGGRQDLQNQVIRVLHSLSFLEDPTRILRAVRFAVRFDFELEKQTHRFLKAAIRNDVFAHLSGDRFTNELRHLFKEDNRIRAMEMLQTLKVLPAISRHLRWTPEHATLFNQVDEVLGWYKLSFLEPAVTPWHVYLVCLLKDLPTAEVPPVAERLRLSRVVRLVLEEVSGSLQRLMYQLRDYSVSRPSHVHALVEHLHVETLLIAMAASGLEETQSNTVRKHLSNYLERKQHIRQFVTGEDLKALGIEPGPIFGEVLERLFLAQLDGDVTSREQALDLVVKKLLPDSNASDPKSS